MSHASGAEGSDTVVYPELARANLLRMRGDYKAAEDQCLSILRRFPNNATANVLLGDICTEKGDLEQAMQWYEMALDLTPESQAAQHKLEQVRQRFKDKETVQTVEQLGLPTTKSRAGLYAISLIVAIFIIAVIAYALGFKHEEKAVMNDPAVIRARGTLDSGTSGQSDGGAPGTMIGAVREDDPLLKTIQGTGTEGARVVAAMEDPRTHALTVTYSVLEGEDARSLGATVAGQAFDTVPEAPLVTLRGVKQGHVAYVADAMRTRYEETLAQSWKTDHASNPNAWVDHVLLNEWPAQTNQTPVTPPVQPTPTTGGDQPPGDTTTTDSAASNKTAPAPAAAADKKSEDKTPSTDNTSPSKGEDSGQTTGGTSGPPGSEDQTTGATAGAAGDQ